MGSQKICQVMLMLILLLSLVSCNNHCDIAYKYCGTEKTVFTSTQGTWCSDPQEFFCYRLEKGKVVASEVMITKLPQECQVQTSVVAYSDRCQVRG